MTGHMPFPITGSAIGVNDFFDYKIPIVSIIFIGIVVFAYFKIKKLRRKKNE